jgi:hypothetical protein
MKTKSIKINPDTHKAVKVWAAQQGIPLGEAVERLLTQVTATRIDKIIESVAKAKGEEVQP